MNEQRWIWHSNHGDLFLNIGETIRFVVENEVFVDCNPQTAPNRTCEQEPVPYTLTASCNKDGMGSILWWK